MHFAPLRIDAGHDVFDCRILAGRVHALKDDEERPTIFGIEFLLQLGQTSDSLCQERLGRVLVNREAKGVGGVTAAQMKAVRFVDPTFFDDLAKFHCRNPTFARSRPPWWTNFGLRGTPAY